MREREIESVTEKIVRFNDFLCKRNHYQKNTSKFCRKIKGWWGFIAKKNPKGRKKGPVIEPHMINILRYAARFGSCLVTNSVEQTIFSITKREREGATEEKKYQAGNANRIMRYHVTIDFFCSNFVTDKDSLLYQSGQDLPLRALRLWLFGLKRIVRMQFGRCSLSFSMHFTVSTPVRVSMALAFISAIEAQVDRCFSASKKYLCCTALNSNFMTKEQFKNLKDKDKSQSCLRPKAIICRGSYLPIIRRCLDIVEGRITDEGDGGSFFLPASKKNTERISMKADLLSVDDLNYAGVLKIRLFMTVEWTNNAVRWDERGCRKERQACDLFLNRTANKKVFITQPENTKSYDFELENDVTSDLLSKKMTGYPLRIHRDGRVEWRGVIHVALNCEMDVYRFPFDK